MHCQSTVSSAGTPPRTHVTAAQRATQGKSIWRRSQDGRASRRSSSGTAGGGCLLGGLWLAELARMPSPAAQRLAFTFSRPSQKRRNYAYSLPLAHGLNRPHSTKHMPQRRANQGLLANPLSAFAPRLTDLQADPAARNEQTSAPGQAGTQSTHTHARMHIHTPAPPGLTAPVCAGTPSTLRWNAAGWPRRGCRSDPAEFAQACTTGSSRCDRWRVTDGR